QCGSNLKWSCAHNRYSGSHRHIVISNSEFRKSDFRRYSGSQSNMSRTTKLSRTSLFGLGLTLLLALGATTIPWTREQPLAATDLQISVGQFREYSEEWSEPEGYF